MALSEEFTLTTAELSYLQDRKVAYENLAKRTGLEGVKSVCLALQQSERYGTPLGQSLRVMAQENRDMRMNEAEKKAAALPPKLTVPMILFFLPVPVHRHSRADLHQGRGDASDARAARHAAPSAEPVVDLRLASSSPAALIQRASPGGFSEALACRCAGTGGPCARRRGSDYREQL